MTRATRTFRVYFHAGKESMYDQGARGGLTSEVALRMFSYFNDIEIEVVVDEATGEVVDWRRAPRDAQRRV